MTDPNDRRSVLEREAEAEEAQRKIVAESAQGLDNRCPECGALGSLEEIDGQIKCIDCDVAVAVTSKLGGLGRK
jgi:uncharacterized protein (DUF983 family)